jgi:hypothetical protein
LQRIERHGAFHREHDGFAELRGVGKTRDLRAAMLRDEVLKLAGVAGAENDLVPVLDEPAGEGFPSL